MAQTSGWRCGWHSPAWRLTRMRRCPRRLPRQSCPICPGSCAASGPTSSGRWPAAPSAASRSPTLSIRKPSRYGQHADSHSSSHPWYGACLHWVLASALHELWAMKGQQHQSRIACRAKDGINLSSFMSVEKNFSSERVRCAYRS